MCPAEPAFTEGKMTISRKTELGEIKISDQIIEDMISDIVSGSDMRTKIWPVSKYSYKLGKLYGRKDSRPSYALESSTNKNGGVKIEFSVIVRFGISIRKTTKELSDRLYDSMRYQLGTAPDMVTINIAAVKSKQIARRNTRVIFRYNSEE